MTPFGEYIRSIRKDRGIPLIKMASHLRVSSAYLSALENGHRGRPSKRLEHQICQYLAIIWDDATYLSRLSELSDPKPKMNLSGLSTSHFELGNRLSELVPSLTEEQAKALIEQIFAASELD